MMFYALLRDARDQGFESAFLQRGVIDEPFGSQSGYCPFRRWGGDDPVRTILSGRRKLPTAVCSQPPQRLLWRGVRCVAELLVW
jgi:hypothetical protein